MYTTMYSFLLMFFPIDVRNLIWEYSDPTTDRVMWPDYRPRYEDWGWYGRSDLSCIVCGLLTHHWYSPDDETYLIPSYHNHLEGYWHFTLVCSARCEKWDDLTQDLTQLQLTDE